MRKHNWAEKRKEKIFFVERKKKSTSVLHILLVKYHGHPLEKCASHSVSWMDCARAGSARSDVLMLQMLRVRPLCCSGAAITVLYSYRGIWAIWNCPLSCLLPITASPPLCSPSSKTCTRPSKATVSPLLPDLNVRVYFFFLIINIFLEVPFTGGNKTIIASP